MRYVCFGPSALDDPIVNAITQRRAALFGKSQIVEMPEGSSQEDFDRIRQEMQKNTSEIVHSPHEMTAFSSEKMHPVVLFPDIGGKTEEEVFDGKFASSRMLHDTILPNLRNLLHQEMCANDEPAVLHVDIGQSIIPIYIAYFATLIGYQLIVSFHFKAKEEGQPFRLGGISKHAMLRPLGRRYLVSAILHGASTIFVDSAEMVGTLTHLFPQCKRELLGDPLSDFCFEDGPIEIPELKNEVQ